MVAETKQTNKDCIYNILSNILVRKLNVANIEPLMKSLNNTTTGSIA